MFTRNYDKSLKLYLKNINNEIFTLNTIYDVLVIYINNKDYDTYYDFFCKFRKYIYISH